MTQVAIETFSTFGVGVLCLALAIMVLSIFFTLLGWLSSGAKPESLAVRGVLKKDTWATVHTTGDEKFDRVRFVGFTSAESLKSRLPADLHGMVILEDESKRRFLIRAKAIRMIVVEPAATGK
jgi:hypothetical protein